MELSEQEMRTFDLGQDRDIISIDMQLTMEIVTPLLYILHLLKCFSIALLFFLLFLSRIFCFCFEICYHFSPHGSRLATIFWPPMQSEY